jgi:hypothetical protein
MNSITTDTANTSIQTTNNIDDKLYRLMIQEMNTEEQQLFINNFKLYLQYGNDDSAFVISLDDVWEWIGFSEKSTAKRLLTKKFIENKDFVYHLAKRSNGLIGSEKEKILLNVTTFKKFCMKASTKRADEICDYYLKMENIMHKYTIEKINDMKLNIEHSENKLESTELKLLQTIEDYNENKELDRHNIFLQANDNKDLVYIMKIKVNNNNIISDRKTKDSFIIKIGSTSILRDRINKLSSEFGCQILIIDIFLCENNYKFERFLHTETNIIKYKYSELINNKKLSTETYLMNSNEDYNKVKRIIQNNIHKYHEKTTEDLKLLNINKELDLKKIEANIKLEEIKLKSKLCNIYKDNQEELTKILQTPLINYITNNYYQETTKDSNICERSEISLDEPKNEIITPFINNKIPEDYTNTNKGTVNNNGPIVQVYDSNDLTKLLFVYKSITEATREVKESSYTHIKFASTYKTLYLGYRWFLVDRTDPKPNNVKLIGETAITQSRKAGFVAMLNEEKNQVIKVFVAQKDAADSIGQQSSAMCVAIKYDRILSNHYWCFWDNVPNSLQTEYLINNVLPEKKANVRGSKIQLINPNTNEVVQTFTSISEAQKKLSVSPKTIKLYSMNGEVYNGYKWKIL